MERLFVLKTLSRTQRATKVKMFVGFSLKPLRYRDPALPPLCGRAYSRPFFLRKARMRIIVFTTWRPFLPMWWCREDGCEFRELPLVMPPSKVCPQCNAVVPIRLKVCKSCQHVFRAKRQIEHTLPARAMKRLRVGFADSVDVCWQIFINAHEPSTNDVVDCCPMHHVG